ncbi:MAG TPA: Stp1/IreP family PP2C-type Ser/Thr phosphatase [Clostridiaceae bacterium]|nr:Stp1/IreP family PP2C-type Ser/Thr phosphatase [Clostridiaceae bacterium]HBF77994.1 Stp1/IreP family PP2C-type Ser/Thr phosphatase [Clostridiaceae bacterium]HBG39716.1 Stp1/IreP family PP2C-type Ser/Thr phosphatase [Clostridiaceae bacterium]HBN27462.1 Stp1/IreP family PP2C-type Ser/Thr phosphatase [Clostridiaceae bacterium]HBX47846.1 Stp1/IreP family PP2C-type Ser/Thr phosphatase [Clostridiaceae bacterium]
MIIKCRTDKGKVREINEDYVLTMVADKFSLLIVADGMGGHNAGEIASQTASTFIRDYIFEKYDEYENKEEILRDAVVNANAKVYEKSLTDIKLKGMGTTITCCILAQDKLFLSHVGDSRAYIINKEGINKITQDHSYVQELLDNGSITENEAIKHPQRNVITRAVGVEKYVVVDTKTLEFSDNDILLLCTDGLSNYISNEDIYNIVMDKKESAADELVNIANENGGSDNISVIIARKEDGK